MKNAFTIIEIVLAMTIMVTLAGVGVANFQRSSRVQSVDLARERLRQVFTQARAYAASGRKDCSSSNLTCAGLDGVCNTNDDIPLTGWRVLVDSGTPGDFSINGYCGGTAAIHNFTNKNDVSLPATVTTSMPGVTQLQVLYLPLSRGATITRVPGGSVNNMTITLTDASVGASRTVVVLNTGEVQ